MENIQKTPFYIRYTVVIVGIISTFYFLIIGQAIILPLIYATILAILINPVVNFLMNRKVNKVIAIFIALLILILLVFGLFYFIGSQVTRFSEALPQLKLRFNSLINDLLNWISEYFNVSKEKIHSSITQMKSEGLSSSTSVIGQTLTTISGVFVVLFLIPVYVFMILFYKPLLLEVTSQLFKKDSHQTVLEVLHETKALITNYLLGLLIEAALVATLNSIGLFIIGLDYAILLGVIGALLNIIPYLGGLIAIALPMILAIATMSPSAALLVLVTYLIVQFIDNNFIVPKIVASKVKINALVSIIVVLIGGAIWGIPGMFLSIPLTAICKVVFDRIEQLKPLGYLLGDDMPRKGKLFFKKAIKKL